MADWGVIRKSEMIRERERSARHRQADRGIGSPQAENRTGLPVGISGAGWGQRGVGIDSGQPECARGRSGGGTGVAGDASWRRWLAEIAADSVASSAVDHGFVDRGDIRIHVRMSTHGLLRVAKVEDVGGTVRTFLPGACADEEDRDEGKQDEDDDRQFEEGHTGLCFHVLGVSQFHSVYFLFYSGVFVFCQMESAFGTPKDSEFFGGGAVLGEW
jgi:hypothetical protein